MGTMADVADPDTPDSATPDSATPDSATPDTPDSATPGAVASPAVGANADVAALSYEKARDELVDIVARLENGQAGLEESMGLWQRGEALAAHCASWLDAAEARITAGD